MAGATIAIAAERREGTVEQARQFCQSFPINLAFELDHGLQFHPVLIPPPGIEFRTNTCAQGYITITSNQTQQIPYLFLPFVVSSPVTPYPLIRHLITQPVTRPADNLDMPGM